MPYAYGHLGQFKNSTTGLADEILWAPLDWFAANGIAVPVPAGVAGDQVTVNNDHTFIATKGFIKMLCAPFKNKFDGSAIGEVGSQKFDEKLEFFVPGSHALLHEQMKNMVNTPGIALVRDSTQDEELYYQVGLDFLYAWCTLEFGTSDSKSGQKGYKGTLNCAQQSIVIYKGAITLL